jgi:hypothetical protein
MLKRSGLKATEQSRGTGKTVERILAQIPSEWVWVQSLMKAGCDLPRQQQGQGETGSWNHFVINGRGIRNRSLPNRPDRPSPPASDARAPGIHGEAAEMAGRGCLDVLGRRQRVIIGGDQESSR